MPEVEDEEELTDNPEEESSELPEDLRLELTALCRKFSTRELKDRRYELRRARQKRFFWRGIQHLVWNNDSQAMVTMPMGATTPAGGGGTDQPSFQRAFNIYTPYGRAFCATFTGNQPATRFEPSDPTEDIDIRAAACANKFRKIYEKWNPPKLMQQEMGRLFWTDDRVVLWTRWEQDGERFGYNKDGNEKGQAVTTCHGVLEHKCPITISDVHNFVYQKISIDLDIATLKEKYPDIADQITDGSQGTMDDAFARNARIATAEGTTLLSEGGDALAHLSSLDYFWLRPAAYTMLDDQYRDQLREQYPRGIRLAFVGDVFAEAIAGSMDDELRVFHATAGDGQNRNGLGDWIVPVQEELNNLMNMTQEYFEYGIGEELSDNQIWDSDADQDRRAVPGGRQTVVRPSGTPLADCFYTRTGTEPPELLIRFIEYLQGPLAQFLSSQQAAIYGESDKHNETAKGIALLRNQALGLVGLVWMPFTQGWAEVVHQAVKATSAAKVGKISTLVPVQGRKGSTEQVDIDTEDLKGNILSTPETDENFPESWTEKSNKLMGLLSDSEKNPALASIMQLPANQQLLKMAFGLDELEVPGQAANDKQLAEIDDLLLTGPTVDPQTGQPTSTIPIDPDFDDHAAELEAGKRWVVDPEQGQKIKRENPAGFMNVRLHLLLHKQVVDQAQAQQQQQAMALKHGAPAPVDPEAQAAKQLLVKDAADAIQQLDTIGHIPPAYTGGTVTGQVSALKEILDAGVKVSTNG